MPRHWTHLPNTGRQLICASPRRLDIFAHSPSGTLHVAEVEIITTGFAVSIYMPSGNGYVNTSLVGDSHVFGEVPHTFSKVFGPLADDVVGNDDAEEVYAD